MEGLLLSLLPNVACGPPSWGMAMVDQCQALVARPRLADSHNQPGGHLLSRIRPLHRECCFWAR